MSADNSITIKGRLTDAPEVKFTNSGTAVSNFSVAVNKRVRNKDTGEYENGPTSFFDCVAWAQLAENFGEHLDKGEAVIVNGAMEQREYETKEGEKRKVWELIVEDGGPNLRWAKPKGESSFDSSRAPF